MNSVCANCGEPIRPLTEADGDLMHYGHTWTHVDGGPHCDDGYFDVALGEWHDATYASDGNDGWG